MSARAEPVAAARVVVAEDEAIIRLDIVETLTESGYDVVGQAGDGASAVRLIEDLLPDIAVMDIKMPGTDGLAAAEQLAERRLCAVVLLTAFSSADLVRRAQRAGVLGYVVKPFTTADLLPAIEIARSRFEDLRALEQDVAELRGRWADRRLVDRAKGILMDKLKLTEREAFRWLQKTAMDKRVSMRELAELVVAQMGE